MKAAVCHAFKTPLVIEDLLLAAPQAGEVRVRIAACAICHSDLIFIDGGWGGALPAVFGHEAAGVVEAVGSGVERVAPGDHVVVTLIRSCGHCATCADGAPQLCTTKLPLDQASPLAAADGSPVRQGLRTGAFAEEVVVHASQLASIPKSVSLESAALLACGVITGLGAVLNTAQPRPGSRILTIGVGGVGLNCIQGAKIAGADLNVAIDLADEKLDAARRFGATHGLNPASTELKPAVLELTGWKGADFVFVAAGSAAAIEQGLTLLRPGGTLVVVGMTAEGVKIRLEALDIADLGLRIPGSKMGNTRPAVDIPKLAGWYLSGRLLLDGLISGRYPLEAINEAIASARNGLALRNVITF
jgi:Zn-dependent alcohol dehydrogenase